MVELAERLAAIAPGKEAEESLFRQFRHGSDRGGHQAGAVSHAARQDHRVSRMLSRTHAGRAFAHRVKGRAAQGIWRAARRRVSHSVSEFLPLSVRQSFAVHLRRGGHVSGDAKFSSAWSIRRKWRRFSSSRFRARADTFPRRRNFCIELQRICRKHGILLVCRRSAERHGAHGEMVGRRSRRASSRTFFAWPRESLRACRFPRPSRARA